jgi:hypothetical protein
MLSAIHGRNIYNLLLRENKTSTRQQNKTDRSEPDM